jgi:hypothetical protein
MAEGRSNAGIAAALVVSGGAVEKHVAGIFGKLDCCPQKATTAGCSRSCATSGPETDLQAGLDRSRCLRDLRYWLGMIKPRRRLTEPGKFPMFLAIEPLTCE